MMRYKLCIIIIIIIIIIKTSWSGANIDIEESVDILTYMTHVCRLCRDVIHSVTEKLTIITLNTIQWHA